MSTPAGSSQRVITIETAKEQLLDKKGEKIGYNTIELRWRRMTLRVWHRQSWGLLSSLLKIIKTPGGRRRRALQGMREIDPSATSTRRRVQNEFLPKALAKLSKVELTEWAETFGVVGASSMSSAELKDVFYAIPSGVQAGGTKIIPPSRTEGTTLAKYLPPDKNGKTVISLEAGFEYVEKIHQEKYDDDDEYQDRTMNVGKYKGNLYSEIL